MASPVSVNRQQVMEAAATESLSRQTIMVSSALGDAADALAANKGMRCLVRRRADLEAAMAKYEEVFIRHQQAADANACVAAEKARRILRDSSDEALDLMETLIDAKVEEKASIVEVEDEICAAKAEVVVERLAKDLVMDEFCAKDELESSNMVEVVVEMLANKVEVDDQIDAKDKLKQEFGAKEWVVANEALNDGEVSVIEMEEFRIAKVRVKECPNMEVLLCSGQLDPGEGGNKGWHWKEVQVKQELKEVWYGGSLKLLDFLGYETELLQVPEIVMLRFVNWVSSSLTMIGDFG